jgi:hypothetical protein
VHVCLVLAPLSGIQAIWADAQEASNIFTAVICVCLQGMLRSPTNCHLPWMSGLEARICCGCPWLSLRICFSSLDGHIPHFDNFPFPTPPTSAQDQSANFTFPPWGVQLDSFWVCNNRRIITETLWDGFLATVNIWLHLVLGSGIKDGWHSMIEL